MGQCRIYSNSKTMSAKTQRLAKNMSYLSRYFFVHCRWNLHLFPMKYKRLCRRKTLCKIRITSTHKTQMKNSSNQFLKLVFSALRLCLYFVFKKNRVKRTCTFYLLAKRGIFANILAVFVMTCNRARFRLRSFFVKGWPV